MKYPLLFYNGKRPDNSGDLIKKELINYIQEESKKNHFPSRRELKKRFHLRLNNICGSIYNLYGLAQLTYFQVQNQEIKSKKANLLLEIVLENLEKFGLNLVKCRRVAERGIDILALEKGKLVGIELKAYNAKEKLKARDILQTERFITEEHLYKAILITSTDLKDNNLPLTSTIKLVYYTELCNLITPNQIEKL